MKAVILAGGKGVRLRPLTFSIPKPLLPVGENPILDIMLSNLKKSGINEVILSIGYQGEIIQAFCADGSKYELSIRYINEDKPLGTAGPLSLMLDCFDPEDDFLLINGDIYTHLVFQDLIEFHKKGRYSLTVAYKDFEYQSPYGVLVIEGDKLSGIVEKPKTIYKISSGIYVLNASVLNCIPHDMYFTMPELINVLLQEGREIGTYHIREFWLGIEQIKDFDKALAELNKVELNPLEK
ncbi:MAG: sugar phosphate nucleotidyltransferase [Thermodesulfobacteriota bacterium]